MLKFEWKGANLARDGSGGLAVSFYCNSNMNSLHIWLGVARAAWRSLERTRDERSERATRNLGTRGAYGMCDRVQLRK